MAKVEIGTEVFNAGDIMNEPKFGTVVRESGAGRDMVFVQWEDGTEGGYYRSQFGDTYLGHSGTRLVTRAAYDAWRASQAALLKARLGNR